jgi:hypothetical protein
MYEKPMAYLKPSTRGSVHPVWPGTTTPEQRSLGGTAMKLPPDRGIAHMRHVFDELNAKRRGKGAGPPDEPTVAVAATPGGADTVNTIVPGGPGPGTTVSDGGGRKMTSAKLYVIFWGDGWQSVPAGSPSISDVLNDIASILATPYLDGLREYTPSFTRATLEAAYFLDGYNPPSSFTSNDTDYIAWYMMAYGPIPEELETIVCVMMPPGITHSLNGEHSFSIVPNLTTVPVLWVRYRAREGISCAFSHELVETITDPDGTGIQIDPRGISDWNEIGDACNNLCRAPNGVSVQSYWSASAQACIIPTFVPVVARQISCIRKHEHADINHPIRWVGGIDIPSRQAFSMTQVDCIAAIDRGERFFVQGADGSQADVRVFVHFPPWGRQGIRYIATVADRSKLDNLLSLPDCPRGPLDQLFPYG